ncbi:hypothetical protein M885DRAFT_533445 [Pelagophyceae sp. CCMP2097]|nr:hypothetical protein M885DRAFT_533445 [Pelagophyceae sp. CCMP2097]
MAWTAARPAADGALRRTSSSFRRRTDDDEGDEARKPQRPSSAPPSRLRAAPTYAPRVAVPRRSPVQRPKTLDLWDSATPPKRGPASAFSKFDDKDAVRHRRTAGNAYAKNAVKEDRFGPGTESETARQRRFSVEIVARARLARSEKARAAAVSVHLRARVDALSRLGRPRRQDEAADGDFAKWRRALLDATNASDRQAAYVRDLEKRERDLYDAASQALHDSAESMAADVESARVDAAKRADAANSAGIDGRPPFDRRKLFDRRTKSERFDGSERRDDIENVDADNAETASLGAAPPATPRGWLQGWLPTKAPTTPRRSTTAHDDALRRRLSNMTVAEEHRHLAVQFRATKEARLAKQKAFVHRVTAAQAIVRRLQMQNRFFLRQEVCKWRDSLHGRALWLLQGMMRRRFDQWVATMKSSKMADALFRKCCGAFTRTILRAWRALVLRAQRGRLFVRLRFSRTRRRVLRAWRAYVDDVQKALDLLAVHVAASKRRIMRAWRGRAVLSNRASCLLEEHLKTFKRSFFQAWQSHCFKVRLGHDFAKSVVAAGLRKVVRGWAGYVLRLRTADDFRRRCVFNLRRSSFKGWRHFVRKLRRGRALIRQWMLALVLKAFHSWKSTSLVLTRLGAFILKVFRSGLSHTFNAWRHHVRHVLKIRRVNRFLQRLMRAALKKVVRAWAYVASVTAERKRAAKFARHLQLLARRGLSCSRCGGKTIARKKDLQRAASVKVCRHCQDPRLATTATDRDESLASQTNTAARAREWRGIQTRRPDARL